MRAVRADERPVVKAGALGPVGAAQPLPPVPRDQGSELVRAPRARRGRDHLAARHGHHVRDLLLLQPGAQLRVAAVDLVARDPGERHPRLHRPPDHPPGQLRLRRERHVIADPRGPAPVPVPGPFLRQVQLPVGKSPRPIRPGIRQEHPGLRVLDPPGGARVPPAPPPGPPDSSPRTGARRPGTRPHPTARSSAAAASRPATRPPRTPPATTSSSAPRATAAPARTTARACAPPSSRTPPRPARTSHRTTPTTRRAHPRPAPARHPRNPAWPKPGRSRPQDHAATPYNITARCCSTRSPG